VTPPTRDVVAVVEYRGDTEAAAMGLPTAKREHYLRGECLVLALALHARTGWEIVSIEDGDPEDPEVCHVLVRLPDGRTLDADGLHEDYEVTSGLPASWTCTTASFPEMTRPETLADADEVLRATGLRALGDLGAAPGPASYFSTSEEGGE
jgi:hypothetical protein